LSAERVNPPFRLGVVEGFFGRQWSWQARTAYAAFLADIGCNSYVYAPKNDDCFRKFWQLPCPPAHLAHLQALRAAYADRGVDFGIGLSPFELHRNFSPGNREVLRRKIGEINAIAPDTLCILFDDMMGDLTTLAATQVAIIDFICSISTAKSFVVCPTYYSSDPLLAKHFGARPEHYLEDLGKGLEQAVAVFWTGPKVISEDYPRLHLQQVAAQLQRKPLLWDNYPVNDAKRLTPFLHLASFKGREPQTLRELTCGHLANPMNQPWLSQLPLWTLAARYAGASATAEKLIQLACEALCPPPLAEALLQDAELFQKIGLNGITTLQKHELLQKYRAFSHPMAGEILAWLNAEYSFDPACLT